MIGRTTEIANLSCHVRPFGFNGSAQQGTVTRRRRSRDSIASLRRAGDGRGFDV
jgi:hypothetical protein